MKKLALSSLLITIVGFLIPIVNHVFLGIGGLVIFANVLIYSGLFFSYLFFTMWQAEIGRSRLLLVTVITGVLMTVVLVYSHFRFEKGEEIIVAAEKHVMESQRQYEILQVELELKEFKIDSLTKVIESNE